MRYITHRSSTQPFLVGFTQWDALRRRLVDRLGVLCDMLGIDLVFCTHTISQTVQEKRLTIRLPKFISTPRLVDAVSVFHEKISRLVQLQLSSGAIRREGHPKGNVVPFNFLASPLLLDSYYTEAGLRG